MNCPSRYTKKCNGELKIHARGTGLARHPFAAGRPSETGGLSETGGAMNVLSVVCGVCGKVWTREALMVEGLNADSLQYSAQ